MTAAAACPLHGTTCRPADPEHDRDHRTERGYVKMRHYATIYGGPPEGPVTPEQQAVYDYLDSIPRRPRLAKEPNPSTPCSTPR